MSSCLEKCEDFSRSKAARIIFGVVLTIICVFGIFRLLDASNVLNNERNSRFAVEPKPINGPLYHFKHNVIDNTAWLKKYDEFLAPYKTPHPNRVKCDYNNPPPPGKSCEVNLSDFEPCRSENPYGIQKKQFCVFLKLRGGKDWKPEFYNATNLPDDVKMPKDLKEFIKYIQNDKKGAWVSCEGQNPVDKENIGPLSYYPGRGFMDFQIPSVEEPIIAIFFEDATRGIVINVECTLWTRGSSDKVNFEFLID